MTTIDAIPTRYAGCHFRSRLEARWAVFFDVAKIAWEYEAEGYETKYGPYLPDFWLPEINHGSYFEVKHSQWNPRADDKCRADFDKVLGLAELTGHECFIANDIPRIVETNCEHHARYSLFSLFYGDAPNGLSCTCGNCKKTWQCKNNTRFCECLDCETIMISPLGNINPRLCGCCESTWFEYIPTDTTPRLVDAFKAARSARFEHGESGAT